MTPELITAYLSLRRRFPTLSPKDALTIARDNVKAAALRAATPKRKRARVATLWAREKWEAGPGRGGRRGRE